MIDLWASVTSSDFLPHGYCLSWKPWLIWLHVVSDILIVAAYFSIPVLLLRVARRRPDFPFGWMIGLFGLFIFSCGATHLMSVWTLWFPHYGVEGIVKAVTAVASVGTAVALLPLAPKIIALPSPSQLEAANQKLRQEIAEREKAEHALHEREQQLQLMIQTVESYAILSLDSGGHVTSWNQGAERINGYRAEEICGKHFSIFYTAEDIENGKPQRALETAREAGSYADEGWRLRKDGSRFIADVAITAVRDTHGRLKGYTKITRDITARHREQARFQALLEVAPDAIVVADQQGKIVLVNTQTERQFGYERQEILNQEVERLIPQRFQTALDTGRRQHMGQPPTAPVEGGQELSALRKDGTEFPVEIAQSPLETEEGPLVMTIIRDVTDRREAERQLAQHTGRLARSNAELERFVYVASHDLREPLRKIRVFGDRLRAESEASLGERSLRYLDRMLASAARMETLILDLLDYSRTQQRSPEHFQTVDLRRVATDVVDDLATLAERVGARVEFDELPIIEAEPTEMRQLLQNLVSNALKFRREQGQHRVKISGSSNGAICRFTVEDNGIGFEPDAAAQIFEVFKRLHSRERYQGNGIGLAICRRIVERHGGTIRAHGRLGYGAVFDVELPVTQRGRENPE